MQGWCLARGGANVQCSRGGERGCAWGKEGKIYKKGGLGFVFDGGFFLLKQRLGLHTINQIQLLA